MVHALASALIFIATSSVRPCESCATHFTARQNVALREAERDLRQHYGEKLRQVVPVQPSDVSGGEEELPAEAIASRVRFTLFARLIGGKMVNHPYEVALDHRDTAFLLTPASGSRTTRLKSVWKKLWLSKYGVIGGAAAPPTIAGVGLGASEAGLQVPVPLTLGSAVLVGLASAAYLTLNVSRAFAEEEKHRQEAAAGALEGLLSNGGQGSLSEAYDHYFVGVEKREPSMAEGRLRFYERLRRLDPQNDTAPRFQ